MRECVQNDDALERGGQTVLNLYLVPRHSKPVRFTPTLRSRLEQTLREMGIIGRALSTEEFAPGLGVANLFHIDAEQHVLPGELTFESLSLISHERPHFLPRVAEPGAFDGAECPICDDVVDPQAIDLALDKLNFFSIESVRYSCPSCCVDVPFSDLAFGQVTAVANAWIYIEGLAFGRLKWGIVDHLSKVIGHPLIIVPEVPEQSIEEWSSVSRIIP